MMILPLACNTITLKKIEIKKCIMNKEEKKKKERRRDEIKFGMTSIPLRHAPIGSYPLIHVLQGVTL